MNILAKIFGTQSERDMKAMQPLVDAINALEPEMQKLSDDELKARTAMFRQQLADGAKLDDLMVPAFATVREASRRVLDMRHFDVQLIGGIALHKGEIAEMKTGEGKTLVATLPVYLNALKGEGVHVITVNDYLAARDAEKMGKLYNFLGLTVGAITHGVTPPERKAAYSADITYGTNNEFGFDYLRDNMKFRPEDKVQRGHAYAIVDEVDSILIDEARTPLIISGPGEDATDLYYKVDGVVPYLKRGEVLNENDIDLKTSTGDYTVNEKNKSVELTSEGVLKVEKLLGVDNLYDPTNMDVNQMVQMALKAHALYERDRDYVVRGGKIIIVDEFTGRLMPGRRWSEGLHQAIEAKEQRPIQQENQTLATVTFQNYFRMYKKLSGMTGTAATEAAEFEKIYKLPVIEIPTNKKLLREEFNDVVYKDEIQKFRAVAREAKARQEKGQPVLIGTVSVEKSELLSRILTEAGVAHDVLNAKNHAREAAIVAQAGRKGAVTVSTNMAGRGTDITLGGNAEFLTREVFAGSGRDPDAVAREDWDKVYQIMKQQVAQEHDEVIALGGLHVIGTERHESRRVDNQLRGRAGRQGDPGSSQFFLSLDDTIVRVFGGDRLKSLMERLQMPDDEPIESKILSKLIAKAQKDVEQRNFDIRKQLIEYDDVLNMQRQAVYGIRDGWLNDQGDRKERIAGMVEKTVEDIFDRRVAEGNWPEGWDWDGLSADVAAEFGVELPVAQLREMKADKIQPAVVAQLLAAYDAKEQEIGPAPMRDIAQSLALNVIDNEWRSHLTEMDTMKQGIGLRGYGQKDPLLEYKREAYEMFSEMMKRINSESLRYVFGLQKVEQVPQSEPILLPQPVVQPETKPETKPLAELTAGDAFTEAAETPKKDGVPVVKAVPPKAKPGPAATGL